ncbi:hypothetical protein GTO10_02390 [Candidatus Saccharibacteria bacterium]|nr:hypothetical protein [Candidatus Saccharibacteria bacterium]
MGKEYWVVAAIALFILSSVLESIAGPVQLTLSNAFAFLSASYLSVYPLTAVAIGVRALAFVLSAVLVISLIERQYFLKATILFAVGVLAELYAVQQLATKTILTPVTLTLSFAYAGVGLAPVVLFYILRGAFGGVATQLAGEPEEEERESRERVERLKDLSTDKKEEESKSKS